MKKIRNKHVMSSLKDIMKEMTVKKNEKMIIKKQK